jgi:trehalose synthase
VLNQVDVGAQSLEPYAEILGPEPIRQLRELAAPMRGLKVLHLNATPFGGGVSELLRSVVPLERDLGIDADWQIISADEEFFSVTKHIHNALQGERRSLTREQIERYRQVSMANAQMIDTEYDVVIAHDPQTLAMRHYRGGANCTWIWRCHIDTSDPAPDVWQLVAPYITEYDAAVFTMEQYVPRELPLAQLAIIPPAIDPLSPKNLELPEQLCRHILGWIGINLQRPLVCQVSRFDPWKDPMGVISAYRMVRERVPGLQLALVGSMAMDDPQGWEIYRHIMAAADSDPQIYIFTNLSGVGNVEVNCFQRLSDVIVQKSIREGFGLVVSEALWKRTPVVAGRAGGIPLQMPEGADKYLVTSVEETAERMQHLLEHPEERREFGDRGHEHVRQHYLIPRLVKDELSLIASLRDER